MAQETRRVDIAALSEAVSWEQLVDEVRATRTPAVLRAAGEDVAILTPVSKRRPHIHRGKPIAANDSLWSIIGTGEADPATDVSEHVDRYLADAKLSNQT